MRRVIRTVCGVAAGMTLLATSTSAAETPSSVVFVQRATRSVEPRTTIVPAATTDLVQPTDAELQDLATLARSQRKTLEEVVVEYGWRAAFGKAADDLSHRYRGSFSEAAAEDGGGRISFTGDAPPDVATRVAAARLPVPVRIRDRVGWSQADIVEAAQRVHYAVPSQDVHIGTSPDAENGEIRVTVGPESRDLPLEQLRARIREAATSEGPLRDALDQVAPTVTVVIEVVPAELAPRGFPE